jgi:alpha-glucosidase
MSSGEMIEGGKTLTLDYTLAENPYFARAGAIIPMNPRSVKNLQDECSTLVLALVPGGDGETTLYEDDGESKYYDEQYAVTHIAKRTEANKIVVRIAPRKGAFKGALAERRYELRFLAQMPPVKVMVNGVELSYSRFAKSGEWCYDGYTLSPIIYTDLYSCDKECVIELEFDSQAMATQPRLYGKQGVFARCRVLTPEFKERYSTSYDPYAMLPDEYLNVSQAPNFITEYPFEIIKWLNRYDESIEKCLPSLKASGRVDEEFLSKLEAQLR